MSFLKHTGTHIGRYFQIVFFIHFITFFVGCRSDSAPQDTATSGKLKIIVDESYKPLIDAQVAAFESIYTYADIEVIYKSEADAFYDLLNDSAGVIIVSRNLTEEEKKLFVKWEIVPMITKIANDAVAVIASRDIADTTFTLDELGGLISGRVSSTEVRKIVFDNSNSGITRYCKEKLQIEEFSANCFAMNSNQAVLDYVSKNKSTIGLIGLNWISDQDDSASNSFRKQIKVVELAESDTHEPCKPYQAYIVQKTYPLTRETFVINRQARNGLGTGFTAFMAGEKGQRIVLKYGLVPATMPVRLVEIINEEIEN